MKLLLALLSSSLLGFGAWQLGGDGTAGLMLSLISSIVGWYLGKRLWLWINQ